MPPLLLIRDLGHYEGDKNILSGISLAVSEGDVVIVQGKSGSGKTTLLKCIASLIPFTGSISHRGSSESKDIPKFRTRIAYVPQRPSLLPGTPNDFLKSIATFQSRQRKVISGRIASTQTQSQVIMDLASSWGVDELLWGRNWSTLSGGEVQRIALAIAVGLDTAEVLLLDEPTSALDLESSLAVENLLVKEVKSADRNLKAILWISHSEEQADRVGTRFLWMADGGCHERVHQPV